MHSQIFTDGYFNFPAPECFEVPEAQDFGIELKFLKNGNIPTYSAPLVADINNDGTPNVIAMSANGYGELSTRDILIFDGQTGQVIKTISTPFMNYWGITPIAIADLTGDGYGEIVIATIDDNRNNAAERGILICYDFEGNELWRSNDGNGNILRYGINSPRKFGATPSIADFNGDGIPEIYIYNEIYNGQTGTLLVHGGPNGIGMMMNHYGYGAISTSVAADFTSSPGLELAAGNTVYEVDITNINGVIGNSMVPINANFNVLGSLPLDGFTSTADITLDGQLEVVVSTIRQIGSIRSLYVWNPRTNQLVAEADLPNGSNPRVGMAFIGDVNGDGRPEIGLCTPNRVNMYAYDGTTQLNPLWNLPSTDGSGLTKITMFDFNQNGRQEIVYRDETSLRIIDGSNPTPQILASFPSFSNTAAEGAVIADINGNGSAEIIVSSNNNNTSSGPHIGSIQVFSSSTQSWAPARSVWNQYQYFNVNIRDDLSIPVNLPNHGYEFFTDPSFCPVTFKNRPLNSFYVQSTYYDENGCLVNPIPDPSIIIDSIVVDCDNDYTIIVFYTILNISQDAPTSNILPVSFYAGNPLIAGLLLRTIQIGESVGPGEINSNFQISINNAHLIDTLFAVVNDDGSQTPPISFPITQLLDCKLDNNIDFKELSFNFELETYEESYTCDSTMAGMFMDVFEAASGCDSIHTSNVILAPSEEFFEEIYVCNPMDTGTFIFSGQNQFGCDSVHITISYLAPNHEVFDTTASCNPLDTGIVVEIFANQFGCDSTIFRLTKLLPSHEFHESRNSCDPLDTSLLVLEFINQFGCDSTLLIETTYLGSDDTFEYDESCNPIDTWTIVLTYTNSFGCDSIHYFITNLLPTDTITELISSPNPADTGLVYSFYTNQFGCDSVHILITEIEPRVFIPNVFSPNGDGVNDEFSVFSNGMKTIHIQIFDRWGGLVFESRDTDTAWDGNFRGEPASEGVYTYQVFIEFANDSEDRFSGDVLLIR